MLADEISQVRRFNRLVTQRVGALDDHFLGRDRPLGESRLLYEIGAKGADLRDLRRRLGLDSGYVTRLVQVREMNQRADEAAARLLDPLTPALRTRLVAAMTDVHRLLQLAGLQIERVDPASPTARWCVGQYFGELNRRFESGFDPGASLPADDRDLVPPRGAFLVASVDGDPVASGAVKPVSPGVGSLKRMWVAETVRGLGIGRRMLEALESQARELGMTSLQLETNHTLQEAIGLYRSAGFREVARFSSDPYAHHWFEKRLG